VCGAGKFLAVSPVFCSISLFRGWNKNELFFANRPAVDIYGSDDLIYPSFGFILWPSYLARCTKVTFPAVPRTASIGDDGLAQPVVVSCVL